MVGHGGSSAGSYLADPTSPIPSHCASIVATSTLRVNNSTLYHQSHKSRRYDYTLSKWLRIPQWSLGNRLQDDSLSMPINSKYTGLTVFSFAWRMNKRSKRHRGLLGNDHSRLSLRCRSQVNFASGRFPVTSHRSITPSGIPPIAASWVQREQIRVGIWTLH